MQTIKVTQRSEARKEEFLRTAETLFNEKGYEHTSVDDIVARMSVAKGLFYYYFDSKDQLLELLIRRLIDEVRANVAGVVARQDLSALEKLGELARSNNEIKARSLTLVAYFNEDRNKALHYLMEDQMTEFMVPAMEVIIRQGLEEGVFHTPYPRETAIAILSTFRVLSHDRLYNSDPASETSLAAVLIYMGERLLGLDPKDKGRYLEPLQRECQSTKSKK